MAFGRKNTKMSETSTQNMFGILAICMAGLAVKIGNSYKKAAAILEDSLNQVNGDDVVVKKLIKEQLKEFYKKKNANSSVLDTSNSEVSLELNNESNSLPKIPSEVLNSELKPNYDWLITKEFENIFFITCYVPFISPTTPLIRTSELENLKLKFKPQEYIESSYPIQEVTKEAEEAVELPLVNKGPKRKKTSIFKNNTQRKQSAIEKNSQKSNP